MKHPSQSCFLRNWLIVGMMLGGLSLTSKGQTQQNSGLSPENFLHRVKNIESFINRFNNQEDAQGNMLFADESGAITESFVNSRNKQIVALFDHQYLNKKTTSIGEFLQSVNSRDKQCKLDFYDPQWFAAVTMSVLYKNQPRELTMVLQNEQTSPRVSKWVIRSVKADFLEIPSHKQDTIHFLPPNSHGTDFIGITRIFSDTDYIKQYASRESTVDPLSIFFYAVYNRELTFKHALQVQFHFLQLNGWILRVEEFNRNAANSGWLIADLIRADQGAKNQYVRQKLHFH